MTVGSILAAAVLFLGAAAGYAPQKPAVDKAADEAAIAALSDREMASFSPVPWTPTLPCSLTTP